ncbi:MAG: cell division protein FtsA [Pseudomonadota bacterium]
MFDRPRNDKTQIAVLDIGASKVACFVARIDDGGVLPAQAEIIGVGYHGAPAALNRARTIDQWELGVRRAVDAAERMAGVRVRHVSVALPGPSVRARKIGVDIGIMGGVVTEEDLDDSLAEGARAVAAHDCASLHATLVSSRIDGEEIPGDPVGLVGSSLSIEMLGLSAKQSLIDNLRALLERCGLVCDEFVAAPYAAAEATLIEDEKDLGVAVIDIGAGSTGYAVYDDGVMIDCGGAPVGGGHVTKDIAQIFGASFADAERVKTIHGAALIGLGDEHRLIDLPEAGAEETMSRASRADLCEVIIPRLEEIFELVSERLPDDQLGRSGLRRAVITGGGSLLVGAREVGERVLGMKCRLGQPQALSGAPETASAPSFAVCAGLIQNFLKTDSELKSTLGLSHQSPHSLTNKSVFGGVEAWLRAKF